MAKNKVYAKINGSEYTITGDEPEDYLFKISRYLDKKIKDTLLANPKHSNTSAAVLTALTVTDELFQVRKEVGELKKVINEPGEKLLLLSEELEDESAKNANLHIELDNIKLQREAEKEDFNQLQKAYNELYENYIKKNEEHENLLNESLQFQQQSNEFEKEVSKMKEKIRELKDELLESEIENVKVNKELKNLKEAMNKRNNI